MNTLSPRIFRTAMFVWLTAQMLHIYGAQLLRIRLKQSNTFAGNNVDKHELSIVLAVAQ